MDEEPFTTRIRQSMHVCNSAMPPSDRVVSQLNAYSSRSTIKRRLRLCARYQENRTRTDSGQHEGIMVSCPPR